MSVNRSHARTQPARFLGYDIIVQHCSAPRRPQLDDVSRAALNLGPAIAEPVPWYLIDRSRDTSEPGETPGSYDTPRPEDALWLALCAAPGEGADIAELMRASGMGRSTLYRYLGELAQASRAVQVGWGRWRAADPGGAHDE